MAEKSVCSIEGCDKTAGSARGWCSMHYSRWRNNGDPLVRAKPRGEAIKFLTDIAFKYDGDECLIWPFTKSKGYGWVQWQGKGHVVPRAVCEHVNGPAPTADHQAAHSCGRGHAGCCTAKHLRWATPAENAADKVGHGTLKRGETQWKSLLTPKLVREIRALQGTAFQKDIAVRFGVKRETVSAIFRRQTWAWLP